MEEEPKKENQNQTISEVDKSTELSLTKNRSQDTSNSKDVAFTDSSTNKKSSKRFRDFLMGPSLEDLDSDSSKASSGKHKEESQIRSADNHKEDSDSLSESHEFSFSQGFRKFKSFQYLHSNKKQIIRIIGLVIGILFIIAGIVYEFGASVRLADNVVYGERAVLSVFLILIGILIIVACFGRRLLAVNFLKKIHLELEEAEGQPSNNKSANQNEKSLDDKEKQKDIDENDKK